MQWITLQLEFKEPTIMFNIKPKSELDKLKQKYTRSMRDSFRLSLIDREKSQIAHNKACQIQKQIKKLETES